MFLLLSSIVPALSFHSSNSPLPSSASSASTIANIGLNCTSGTNISTIQWGPCDPTLVTNPSLLCGFFDIPLDYHDPSIGNGRLALIKANATGEKRGTFFMNPGGPGVSGIEALSATSDLLLAQTGGLYDIVSWDPRGVGSLSTPGDVFCFASAADYASFWNGTIELEGINMIGNFTDQQDIDALLSQADNMQQKYDELGVRCQQHSDGQYLRYIGTAATVRDLVAMADALDGPGSPINLIGLSYGTIVGSWFLGMFPERAGRVILDGVVGPEADIFDPELGVLGWPSQLTSSDDVYKGVVTACALAGPEGCAFASVGDGPLDVHDRVQVMLKAAHDAQRANASVPLTSGQLRTQAFWPSMYSMISWPDLMNITLPQAEQVVLAESKSIATSAKRSEILSLFKRGEFSNVTYTTQAIMCSDAPDVTANDTMHNVFEIIVSTSQNLSHMYASQWPATTFSCSFWPERAVERYTGPFNKTLAHNVLVIGNTYDPATPFHGAKAVADGFGDQAALVRLNVFGHTSQTAPGGSSCLNDIILAYTTNGTLPDGHDTVCEVDDTFEVFPGVNTRSVIANLPPGSV
ncbi:TAP-like protein-domain-containing protein [Dichomitus squalens]|uniref:TAP-like protein-domain-containing protein n=1 Tax=Dichomitus squalens TaxID=114155 RepID=A0A4V2JZB3_9APHY|nr:TAP-like protein-domain-containing protein [Dichomitus squalens]